MDRASRAHAARPRLLTVLGVSIGMLLVLELVLRLVALLGWVALPSTRIIGFDQFHAGRSAETAQRLFQDDRALLYRMRPGFQRQYNRMVIYPWLQLQYDVRTNEDGFRTPPFAQHKPPGVFRIACLGDSSTFGMNVEEVDNYPSLLRKKLEALYPGRFEVINLGIPGFTSRQGLELLRQEVVALEPDLVTFAFGTNDRAFRGPMEDEAQIAFNQSTTGRLLFDLRQALDHSYVYRLAQRAVPYVAKWSLNDTQLGVQRVSIDGIRDNIVGAHDLLAQKGAALVVLNTDFYGTDAATGQRAGAEQAGVLFIDFPSIFRTAREARSREIAAAHDLPPLQLVPGQTVFRVEGPRQRAVILRLNRWAQPASDYAMRDDGQGGDQAANDRVWSVTVPVQPGDIVQYSYWGGEAPNLRKEFRDGFMFGNTVRQMMLTPGEQPIDVFGYPYLMSDPTHPDERGQEVIASQLLSQLLEHEKVRAFLAHASGGSAS